MSVSRFRPIRPHVPNSIVSAVEDSEKNTLDNISIKRRSVACKDCQRRRTKCVSGNPCLKCKKHNTLCVSEENSDKRRKSHSKRIEEELKVYRELLNDLLEAMRYSSDDNIDRIVNIVRSESSVSKIQVMVKEVLSQSGYSHPAAS